MIAISNECSTRSSVWQDGFVALLPEIRRRLQLAFRHRGAVGCEEAVADGVMLCLTSYMKLHEQGRAESVSASSLAWFAAKQVRSGRSASGRLNSKEPLSSYAQLRRGIRIEQLHDSEFQEREWIDAFAQDRRSSVLDHVAARLDVAAWLKTLCLRTRRIAADLAKGRTTAEVAARFGLTPGRISQLRRELARSWGKFQNEPVNV